MNRRIDHDEEDRESSEYEELDDEQIIEDNYTSKNEPSTSAEPQSTLPMGLDVEYKGMFTLPDNKNKMLWNQKKVYYENEMEDLVIHEIFGSSSQKSIPGYRSVVVSKAVCIVCNRPESEKIRLFRWPKSEELREQWIHFFKLQSNTLQINPEPFICSFHFGADTFVMVDERIFWKASALPKYRQRRPCITDPFPWEPSAKLKMNILQEQQQHQQPESVIEYKIRYRMPYNKHKSRNAHAVAVLSPARQPHLFYEFHFNRDGLNNTKFYACLNCRKSKSESGIRDVIRTIHLDNTKLLSSGDPFTGHHFACRPHNAYDYRSSWRSGAQNGEQPYVEDIVYVDERGNSIEWESCTRSNQGEISIDSTIKTHHRIDELPSTSTGYQHQPQNIMSDPILDDLLIERPQDEEENCQIVENRKIAEYVTYVRRRQKPQKQKKLKCHLCFKRSFQSTSQFAQHLQFHLENEKDCKHCGVKISCDSIPIFIRRQICMNCWMA